MQAAESLFSEPQERKDLEKALEDFSRDLLILVRTLSVYPDGHPGPSRIAERLARSGLPGHPDGFTIGIAPTRFLYEDRFVGSRGSRVEDLASLLHRKKVMRLHWNSQVRPRDVLAVASALAETRDDNGWDLAEALRKAGVHSIGVDPLDIARIHGALSLEPAAETTVGERGTRDEELETWLWLQDGSTAPEVLASALSSDGLWALGESAPSFPVRLVLRHGTAVDEALGLLSPGERKRAEARLVRAGSRQTVADLVSLVLAEADGVRFGGKASALPLKGLSAEELLDLMARVLAQREAITPRATILFRTLALRFDPDQLLSLIPARGGEESGSAHPARAWQDVKAFLLDLEESRFFADDHLLELERMSAEPEPEISEGTEEFLEDPEPHVDAAYLEIARMDGGEAVRALRRRIEARVPEMSVHEALRLAREAQGAVPHVFRDGNVIREVFSKVVSEIRLLDREERRAAIELARQNEDAILDLTASALIQERRIAGRRFLVDILSALSPATTHRLVARACDAPWYYVRNLATVLGRRKEPGSVPVLQAFLEHPHDKVRQEALRALGEVGRAGVRVVAGFARDIKKQSNDRRLAERILRSRVAAQ